MTIDFDQMFDASVPSLYEAAPVMADPDHPGDLMRDIIEDIGLNVTVAAKVAGLQRTHLSAMLSGEKPVSIESAMKFEAAFGGPAPTVLHGMSDMYESAKALKQRKEIIGGIVRVTGKNVNAIKAQHSKKRVAEPA